MEYDDEEELFRIIQDDFFRSTHSLSIGEGSNLLFVNDFNGIILHSQIKGIAVMEEKHDTVLLRVGASEHWDDVVAFAVSKGWGGIENLSLIPGTAGAAAVQNIGAYGMEIKEVVETVEACDRFTGKRHVFSNNDCRYRYRHSIFKEAAGEHFIITSICLRLQKKPHFKLDYGNLTAALGSRKITLQSVRDAVTEERCSKLPHPIVLGNAGSFFMNPVIPQKQFNDLKNRYALMPSFPVMEGTVKVPAGWLIEQCGFKGKREGSVSMYEKQALVLVNHGGATGKEIVAFAEQIRQAVEKKFGILLVPEVRYVY